MPPNCFWTTISVIIHDINRNVGWLLFLLGVFIWLFFRVNFGEDVSKWFIYVGIFLIILATILGVIMNRTISSKRMSYCTDLDISMPNNCSWTRISGILHDIFRNVGWLVFLLGLFIWLFLRYTFGEDISKFIIYVGILLIILATILSVIINRTISHKRMSYCYNMDMDNFI